MMTDAHSSGDCLLVAIDVAKKAHDVLVKWPSGRSQALRVANQRTDFQRLTAFLHDQGLPVRVALEATADFHRPLAHWLLRHGFEVHLASSVAGARVRFERYIERDPNDADLKRKAYTAVAAKMARVAHSLIKRNADYRGCHEVAAPGDGTSLFGP